MAAYILANDLYDYPSSQILDHFNQHSKNPDKPRFTVSDVSNARILIDDHGFTLEELKKPEYRRTRNSALKRGNVLEFSHCVASEGDRFSHEEKSLILQNLKVSWNVA